VAAARQTAHPVFALGFLTGSEIDWLPEALAMLPVLKLFLTETNELIARVSARSGP
jgi:hypothetical protein